MMLLSPIWFLLYDSMTGLPYMGTTAASVSLPPGSVVDQFRDAVKVKDSDILTGVVSSQLLVYKNKLSFDKRNAVIEEEKEEPLASSHPLNGLGETEKDALAVLVPALMITQPQAQASPF